MLRRLQNQAFSTSAPAPAVPAINDAVRRTAKAAALVSHRLVDFDSPSGSPQVSPRTSPPASPRDSMWEIVPAPAPASSRPAPALPPRHIAPAALQPAAPGSSFVPRPRAPESFDASPSRPQPFLMFQFAAGMQRAAFLLGCIQACARAYGATGSLPRIEDFMAGFGDVSDLDLGETMRASYELQRRYDVDNASRQRAARELPFMRVRVRRVRFAQIEELRAWRS